MAVGLYGGPILWWTEDGDYVALAGPNRTQQELVAIAASMVKVDNLEQVCGNLRCTITDY